MATNGFSPSDISKEATTAAKMQGRNAADHARGSATVAPAGELGITDAGSVANTAWAGGSATITRICGAEQCGQNGIPSSTLWPHL